MGEAVRVLFFQPAGVVFHISCIFGMVMDMKEPTIRIESLSMGYRGKNNVTVVARDINAALQGGELTCLLGPNGAGKSTLLRTLSAFLPAVSGQIFLLGRKLSDYTDKELSKVIGVVLTWSVWAEALTRGSGATFMMRTAVLSMRQSRWWVSALCVTA